MRAMLKLVWTGLAVAALLSTQAAAQAPVGSAFTYQGELAQNGQFIDASSDFQFSLWDQPAGGNQVGALVQVDDHLVVGGRFTVLLDFGDAFEGEARFLEIAVRSPAGVGGFTTLSPRQELTPTPYAVFSTRPWQTSGDDIFFDGSRVGIGTQAPLFRLDVRSPAPRAIFGWTTNPTGNTYGVFGQSAGDAGIGVQGFATADSGDTSGVVGYADSTTGRGVWGSALSASGVNYGVYGETSSSSGYGGFFLNDDGLALLARSTTGNALRGETNATGAATAVHGVIQNPGAGAFSAAVRGENLGSATGTVGVWGSSAGAGTGVQGRTDRGFGVFGQATSRESGTGVWGETESLVGFGVIGRRTNVQGTDPAVRGETMSRSPGAVGVHGIAQGTGTQGATFGVLGQSNSPVGVGVRGQSNTGVQAAGQQFGVHATASNVGGQGVRAEGAFGVYGLGNGGAGVVGESGSAVTPGIWAIGWGTNWLDAPALRADGGSGPAILAIGSTGVRGEGSDTGVVGTGTTASAYGGYFSNLDEDGIALAVHGPTVMGANTPLPSVPAGVVLAVDGKVMCEELEVQLSEDWPDFVFADGYPLLALEQVEAFVREHGHLPDVPSAAEVAASGINVGRMQAALLRKVEELTLHIIELDRKLDDARQENERLVARIAAIEARP